MLNWIYKLGAAQAIKKYVPKALRYALVAASVFISGHVGEEAGAAFVQAIEPLVQAGTIAIAVLAALVFEERADKKKAPETPKPAIIGG